MKLYSMQLNMCRLYTVLTAHLPVAPLRTPGTACVSISCAVHFYFPIRHGFPHALMYWLISGKLIINGKTHYFIMYMVLT